MGSPAAPRHVFRVERRLLGQCECALHDSGVAGEGAEPGIALAVFGFCRSKGLRLKSACVARLFKRPVSRTGWQRTRLCLVGSTALF